VQETATSYVIEQTSVSQHDCQERSLEWQLGDLNLAHELDSMLAGTPAFTLFRWLQCEESRGAHAWRSCRSQFWSGSTAALHFVSLRIQRLRRRDA
jgi:hypothetical protein